MDQSSLSTEWVDYVEAQLFLRGWMGVGGGLCGVLVRDVVGGG